MNQADHKTSALVSLASVAALGAAAISGAVGPIDRRVQREENPRPRFKRRPARSRGAQHARR